MASSAAFVTHVLDLLAPLGDVQARAMFGGHGVYADGVMFALLDRDEVFLKTDEESRPRFVEAGCRQWVFVSRAGRMESTGYFRPPDEAHEDAEAMLPWARLALDAALRARAAKAKGATRSRATAKRRRAKAGGRPGDARVGRAGARSRTKRVRRGAR